MDFRLFNSNVKSVLLYGCESWSLTKTSSTKLQTFINTCLRKILGVSWPDRIRTEDLWKRTGQFSVMKEIGRRRWRWIGHTMRKPASCTARQALQWNPQGRRKRGRPRATWRRLVDDDLGRGMLSWREVLKRAQDRVKWKSVVRGLYPEDG